MITVRASGSKEAQALLGEHAKQVPFAIALTLTRMAQLVQKGEYDVMRKRFDRPVNATMNSVFVRPATKANLQSVVGLKNQAAGVSPDQYLKAAVYGATRRPKRFEKALIAKGVMKQGQYAMPNKAFLDQSGNINGGFVRRLLKAIDPARPAPASGRKARPSRYFAGEVDGEDGIWERKKIGKSVGVRPVFIFTAAPRYKVRVPFFKIAENIIKANFDREFDAAFARATATAR